ncbi:TonB-dependent receptor [Paraburkholderia megapolitana]|uniref:Iron complex outermembrane recepter protein n=1 Tax=Paraburkholderia megapolitana TaxID=420953 RepID=A0A1I3EPR0_9BURK|nr:TonB-dependent siderophore receptor [Paraburkholderia megapolitana]SFI00975.1 iron complex outermembrane recepter protein [Paraburkholderia megapolitana]
MSAFRLSLAPVQPAKLLAGRLAISTAISMAFGAAAPAFAQSAGADAAPGSVLPAVKVEASVPVLPGDLSPTYAGGQVARGADFGVLGKQKMIDVPFSMTTYTAKLIADQQALTLGDVLDNDPAVRVSSGFGNFSQVFVIRGFPLNGDDISLNGLYGVTPRQLVSTSALERVDVFKGANAFLNGASPGGTAIGGGVNLQLKRADDKPLTRVTLETSGSGEFGEQIDVGRRFGSEGQFGIRVNQMNRGGETSIDGEHRLNNTTAVSLDWRGDKLRLYGDFVYQRQKIDDGRPIVYVTGSQIPEPPSATHNYAQPWSFSNLEDTVGIVRAEYDFLPAWTAYVAGGARHTNEHGDYASPTYNGATGVTTTSRLGVPHKEDTLSGEAGVRGHFTTGPVTHMVTASGSVVRIDGQSAYTLSGTVPTSLYDTPVLPRPADKFTGGDLADPGTTALTLMRSVAVSDTLGFLNDRVLFTIGARHQSIHSNGFNYKGVQNSNYDQSLTTPLFGLVVKPWENVAFFANRSEALAQGGQAPNTAVNFGQLLAPYRTKQYEVGVKYDTQRLGASLAAYQIEQPSAYTDSTTRIYGTNGTQRHRGLEAEVHGEPYKGVRLLAGMSLINAKLLDTNGGATDGNRPIGVPSYLFNLGAEYDVPMVSGLTLTARWIHTGSQYLDAANTASIPSWDRFDLGARYATSIFGRPTTFRATVRNVANKAYWSSTMGTYLTQGEPRTFLLSMTTDF